MYFAIVQQLLKDYQKMKNLSGYVRGILNAVLEKNYGTPNFSVEQPRDLKHGDFASNVAMVIAKESQSNPMDVASDICKYLEVNASISKAEVAGPGFINIWLERSVVHEFLRTVLENPDDFGNNQTGCGRKVLVEFVSANPTGPMHVGHCRGAIFGDALCNLLKASGFNVVSEYYINDAGAQVKSLARSLYVRYLQLNGKAIELSDGMYPGDYIIEIAKDLVLKEGESLVDKELASIEESLVEFAVSRIMCLIKQDLSTLGVAHDSFISEHKDIQEKGFVSSGIERLSRAGLLYKGFLEAPKGSNAENWEAKEQLIFRSTAFGDDVDRAVQRSDGTFTYFAGDVGLAAQRVSRGFKDVIMVLGADHIGFVRRMKALFKGLDADSSIDIPIVQLVNLYKDGQPFKMSKRAGNFITAKDVVEEVGLDVLRFVLLSKKNDTVIDFDFELVKEQSKDNPVFYVQYAHARCASVLRNAKHEIDCAPDVSNLLLLMEPDIRLILKCAQLPRVIEMAALKREPHRVIHYLNELSIDFHSFWAQGNDDVDLRFIIEDNKEMTAARLCVVLLVKNTIKRGLEILGINALERM